jgi:hypothetical protein
MVPIQIGSYTELPKWIRYDASNNQLGATGLNSAPFQFDASLAQLAIFHTQFDSTRCHSFIES